MKQQFIQSLKNGQVPFFENEAALEGLSEDLFEPFDENVVTLEPHRHRWNETYFNQKSVDLEFNFSKELVLHLIEVKKHFQQQQGVPSSVEAAPVVASPNVAVEKPVQSVMSTSPQAVENREKSAKPDLLHFKPNERLAAFLQEGNVSKIRSYLMSMLNNRRLSLEELFKSIWYVHEHKPAVFEAEEETAFVQAINHSESAWDVEYFNLQQVYLNKNFSLARLLHLANVRETLMNRGDSNFQQINVAKENDAPQAQAKIEPAVQQNTFKTQSEPSGTASSTQSQRHQQNAPYTPNHSEQENGFIKALTLIGGAVLALAAVLFAIFKK